MPRRIRQIIIKALQDRKGVAALEWALIAGTIVIAVAAAMPGIRTSLTNVFTIISTSLG